MPIMVKLNENQSKHIVNSLRVIGMAQFAAYGYNAPSSGSFGVAIISGTVYAVIELLNIYLLKG